MTSKAGYEMLKLLNILMLCTLILSPVIAQAQGGLLDELEEEDPCSVQLLAEVSAFQPGVPFQLGVWVQPIPGWHGYWHSPRDGGDPPEVFWELPKGWKVSDPSFPAPQRMMEPGDLIAYGYKQPFMLLFTATPPKVSDQQKKAESSRELVLLQANVTWQVCKSTCIYGESEISLELKPADQLQVNAESQIKIRGWAESIPLKKVPKGYMVSQEWIPAVEKGSIRGRWVLRWARKGTDRRPAVPLSWQIYPHALVGGLVEEAKPVDWIPDPVAHPGYFRGKQVTFVVKDVDQGFHPGLLGATMVPSPGKAIGPVSGYPAFEIRGKKPTERTGSD